MSNRGRRAWNKICAQIARPGEASRAIKRGRTREEIIVAIVTEECGASTNLEADDLASDLILELWETKKFGEDFDAVREYVRAGIRSATRRAIQRLNREISLDHGIRIDGRDVPLEQLRISRHVKPMQELRVIALDALGLLEAIPSKHRNCLTILAGGGTPIDVANDLEIMPWEAIRLIKEAREFIHRVDPLDDAA